MCCVVGYVGRSASRMHILEGLARLEYRGYDSAGYACYNTSSNRFISCKVVGGVAQLLERSNGLAECDGSIGLGHTRWATNGLVTEENAHPVFDCTGSCAVVHNGIIEEEYALRQRLGASGHIFRSETDTELIAHLIEEQIALDVHDPAHVIRKVVAQLKGAYAFVLFSIVWPKQLIAVRRRSPLCILRGSEGFFIGSDPMAFAGKADSVVFLPDETYAVVSACDYTVYTYAGEPLLLEEQPLSLVWEGMGKNGFEHYTLKEIYEQKMVLQDVVRKVAPLLKQWMTTEAGKLCAHAPELWFTGCGTSWYASQVAHHYIECISKISSKSVPASELRDRPILSQPGTWLFALSQSGETADTLEAMRYVKQQNLSVVVATNYPMSTMAREADYSFPLHAGVEIAVASSKTLAAHVGLFYLLAHVLGEQRALLTSDDFDRACDNVIHAADLVEEAIAHNMSVIDFEIAPLLARYKYALTIGRGLGFFVAQEAALKLKELAYLFVEAYQAGELKHGPLALIEPGVNVIACSTLEARPYQKLLSSVHEIRARKGHVIAIAFTDQVELSEAAQITLWIPRPRDALLGPLVMLGVVQYLAYRVAYELGNPIDKPRNLAKSVTVE
jgi:glucosamine--fructose-6-phosphate aminotransferase (isomerizing)